MGSGLTDPHRPGGPARWAVERVEGLAEQLFSGGAALVGSAPGTVGPTLRILTVARPTVVLGSSQPLDLVDLAGCRERGVDVIRRRSGGGAVWLDHDMIWVDVFVPADHPRWDADIGRSMWWVGDAWAQALTGAGVDGAEVYRGPLRRTAWSSLVCFAGLGAGEVTIAGRKVVGISQRRTRAGALLQCGLLRAWGSAALIDSLVFGSETERNDAAAAVADAGVGVGNAADAALDGFVASVVAP